MSSQPSHLSDAIYKTSTLDLLKLSDSFVHVHLKAPLLNRCICFPPNAHSRTWINAVCFHLLYWVTLSDFPSASYRWDVFRGQLLLLSIPSCLLFFINVHSITHYTDLGVKLNRDSDWLLNQQYKTISLNIAQQYSLLICKSFLHLLRIALAPTILCTGVSTENEWNTGPWELQEYEPQHC